MTIPTWLVAVGAIWSVIGWVVFARSFRLWPLIALAISMAVVAVIYTIFSLVDVPIETRASWVRAALLMVVFSQGPVLTIVAFAKWVQSRGHGDDA